MTIEFMRPQVDELKPRISVIGVGGAGGNAVANMIAAEVQGVDFIVANTDAQALNASSAERRIQLGLKITQGLGAGSRPEIGRAAAEETMEQVEKALEGSHMCFIAAGMGGGTGTGAAPVIAKAARDRGILTVGVVTKPFSFEGNRRMRSADAGIEELQKHVDTLIVIPNQNLFLIANPNTTFKEAFQMADQVLQQGVRGITDLMVMPGLINLDFADVRSVMSEMGKAMMGTGEATGDNRAIEAAEKAIANPLLDGVSLNGAKGVIVSITGGDDMRLLEVDEAANHIRQLVDQDANIIWGSAFNNELEGRIRVSVVATGIEVDAANMPEPAKSFSFPPRTPMREEKSVAVPQTPAPQPIVAEAAPEAPAAQTPAAPAAEAPAEEKIVLEAPEAAPAAEPLELTNLFNDELLLQPEAAMPTPAPEATPVDEPAASRRWVAEPEPVRRPSSAGATLFERMSNIARGAAKAQVEPEDQGADNGDVPRFLNRQGNQ
ncbi:cell division protein FtsZ [Rhizorhabdus dicambivorans]|uniref:Cell division protein FtsZ n=1 Tax=Rhizorhabdus dicambivorans TaxID=1850238 RepID=A0A2A4G1L8_9SPHN|nr:cell division protein FtsZ [Rhizorhabdus dicambivorans]ATE66625.1 cell division protein FtsZ [Rhizorhabdus dicambivorans]PCE43891.1 cell division protein FtsZ [Rhizorhabdus dicambivorans]